MACHPILALTPKEKQIAALIREGLTNKEIGNRLCISCRTVQQKIRDILRKFKAKNRTQIMLIINGNLEVNKELIPSTTNARILFRAKIQQLKNQGCSNLEIAQTLNTLPRSINRALKELGYPPKYKRNPKLYRKKVSEMRDQGYNVKQIAAQIEISISRVYGILKELKASDSASNAAIASMDF